MRNVKAAAHALFDAIPHELCVVDCPYSFFGFSSGVRHEREHESAGYALCPAAGTGSAHLSFGRLRHAQDKRWRPEIGEAAGWNHLAGADNWRFRLGSWIIFLFFVVARFRKCFCVIFLRDGTSRVFFSILSPIYCVCCRLEG